MKYELLLKFYVGGYDMPKKKITRGLGNNPNHTYPVKSHIPLKSEMVGPEVSFLFETDINFKAS